MSQKKQVVFMTLAAFKKALGIETITIQRWTRDTANKKASNKLSAVDELGTIYRVQNRKLDDKGNVLHDDLDLSKPITVVMAKDEPIENACLINGTGESAFDTLKTL